jgi:SAM-dependent methyltransferase
LLLATLFRLNRFIVYAAAYIGNPLTVGPMLFAEVQIGHRVLHGGWLAVRLADVETLGAVGIFTSLLIGSAVLGVALGGVLGVASWLIARAGGHHETYHEIVDAVVVRFVNVSIRDAEAARARLLNDPIYPFLIDEDVLGSGARVLDLGCGRGLLGVLVGLLTLASEPRSYLGVDRCDRYVRAARQALENVPGCAVQTLDLRDFDPPAADVVVVNDVLRFLPFTAQDALLRRLARALPPGARLFVREKDAAGGWRFTWAAFVDAAKMVLPGHPRHGTHYRRAGDLRNALLATGFSVRDRAGAKASSPAWVLLEAVRRPSVIGLA